MPNLTDHLLDKAVLRAALTTRFENREVREVMRLLDKDVLPRVRSIVERRLGVIRRRGYDLGPVTTKRLRLMRKEIGKVTREGASKMTARLKDGLVPFADAETKWQAELLRNTLPTNVGEIALPTAQQLRAIVTSSPFEGEVLRAHFQNISRRLTSKAMQQIRVGLASGETTGAMVRRLTGAPGLRGVFGTTRQQTATVVRTAVTHVSNGSREMLYRDNTDVIKGVQWVATLDGGTCPSCGSLDGEVWKVGQGVRPPLHHQCRCTTVPVLKSWKEMGIRLPEAKKGVRAQMRADLNGLPAANVKFGQWLKRQNVPVQNEVLGVRRARMFRQGRAGMQDFTNSTGRLYTLDQLERRMAAMQ